MEPKDSKFTLNTDELALFRDRTFFDRKREIISRIISFLGIYAGKISLEANEFRELIPPQALMRTGKISRGENYLGLPYVVLDHPAYFSTDSVFAFRTMFWWAHDPQITFHVSGNELKKIKDVHDLINLLPDDYLVCINSDEWVHHTGKENYISADEYRLKKSVDISGRSFLKIAHSLNLSAAEDQGIIFFRKIMFLLQHIRNR